MPKNYRSERINETIKEILSELLLTGIKDPRVGFVTITAVKAAPDLSTAKVHFSVMGDETARKESLAGLISARNYLRSAIGRELKVRHAPELHFVYDDSVERSLRIEQTLRDVLPEDPDPSDDSGDEESK